MIRRKSPQQDNRSKLVEAAIELNEQLGLEPKIDVTLSEEEIEESIKEAIRVLTPEDVFSDDTTAVLIRLGWGADSVIENDEVNYEEDTYQEDKDEEEYKEKENKEAKNEKEENEEEHEEEEEEEEEDEIKAEEETDAQNGHADNAEEKSKRKHTHTARKKRKSYKWAGAPEFPKELYRRPRKRGRKIDPNSWYAQLLSILLVGGTPREIADKYNAVARELGFKTIGVGTVKYYVNKILKNKKYKEVSFNDDFIQIKVVD
jgi:flagellar biosynthesis GTPase FlhF